MTSFKTAERPDNRGLHDGDFAMTGLLDFQMRPAGRQTENLPEECS